MTYDEKEELEQVIDKFASKISRQLGIIDSLVIDKDVMDKGVAPNWKSAQVPLNGNIIQVYYEDSTHSYFVNLPSSRIPLVSVTTVIECMHEEFDTYGQSYRSAQKSIYDCNCLNKDGWETLSIDQKADRIRKAWAQNSFEATSYGTAAHMGMEYVAKFPEMETSDIYNIVLNRNGEKFSPIVISNFIDGLRPILKGFSEQGYKCVAEPVLVDILSGTAGQSDLVMVNHDQKKIWVLDYKTNSRKPGTDRVYSQMTGYFKGYDNVAYIHYCIQLTYYSVMLMSMFPGYTVEGITILWLNRETGQIEPLSIDFSYWYPVITGMQNYFIENRVYQRALNSL